jgi:Deoxyribonuclease II
MATTTKLPAPMPLAGPNEPVDWMFAYKFNDGSFPGWDDGALPPYGTPGIFGGTVDDYPEGLSQQYVFATSKNPTLVKGKGPIGATLTDPLGATFAQVYHTPGYFYLLWNDQFYGNPDIDGNSPKGHSKGMAAWNEDGEGFVLQVSTPSWPASGCYNISRNSQKTIDAVKKGGKDKKGKLIALDYNTLGCIDDDDVEVAQHFFCLKLTKDDLVNVLKGLQNASVATDPTIPAVCNNGGPADVQALVSKLGNQSASKDIFKATLSTGVQLISKPASMAVPPWQMISAQLNALPLRVISWWAAPKIYSSKAGEVPGCWAPGLGTPGDVDIALTGSWDGVTIDLVGENGKNSNHAKIGISKDPQKTIAIFGDENQQGTLSAGTNPKTGKPERCSSSQNGRGGTFYVLDNAGLFKSLTQLFDGRTAGTDEASTDLSGIEKSKTGSPAKSPAKKTAKAKPKAATGKKTAVKAAPKKAAAKAKPKPAAKKKVAKKTTPEKAAPKKAAPKKAAVKKKTVKKAVKPKTIKKKSAAKKK